MAAGGVYAKSPELTDVPAFVSAQTPQGLRRAMLKNNVRLKGFVNYFGIQFANGRWFAWYFVGADDLKRAGLGFEDANTSDSGNS